MTKMGRSGWPWMKDVETPLKRKDPSNNNNSNDERPWVEDLIHKHQREIQQIQNRLASDDIIRLYDASKHDGLWVLRFLLSHEGDVERSLEAARVCMVFRRKYNLDAKDIRMISPQVRFWDEANATYLRKFVQHAGRKPGTSYDGVKVTMVDTSSDGKEYSSCAVGDDALTMVLPDPDHCGVLFYLVLESLDTQQLADVSQEDWTAAMAYVNEFQFQWNDYLTRTTGRLTKAVHIIDVANVGLDAYNRTVQDRFTSASKLLEDCYPQAVQAYFVCHAPLWIEAPWRIVKHLLPTRVVQKLDFLDPRHRPEDHQLLLKFTPDKLLPQRFGGQYEHWPVLY